MRYPQWFLLLVAVLGILSGCRSSRVSSDIRFWPSGDTKTGPPGGLVSGAL
ncbi:MAG: hypothetical protein ACK583_16065 [Cyanobacteriota bacterium]